MVPYAQIEQFKFYMLKISKLTDYPGMILQFLAEQDGESLSAACIASNLPVQLPTVRKVLKRLAGAQIVSSTLGKDGGYKLARPAADINLADMVAAMEGLDLTDCAVDCDKSASCRVRSHWRRINDVVVTALQSVSLSDLTKPVEKCFQTEHKKNCIAIEEAQ